MVKLLMKNCCLSLVIQNLIIYTSEICLAESEIQQWNFFVESDKTMVSSNVITDSLKADSLLDCTRMCVDVLACCKASFNPLSNTCFLDTTDYCETPSTYSEGSKLATRITQGSCKKIYQQIPNAPNGKYIIYAGKPITVYCVFSDIFGYTFISKTANASILNLEHLYDINSFAVIRHLTTFGDQKQVTVEQLNSYSSQWNLSFAYNGNPGYQGPIKNTALAPYIFLGFLPYHLANRRGKVQGYNVNGIDYTFTNCDGHANSYIVFYFNPDGISYADNGDSNTLTTHWINNAALLQTDEYMDDEFYFEFEVHFGGCGGLFTTASGSGTRAALGLPFLLQ